MPKYQVYITEHAVYSCEIKAKGKAAAEREAERLFLNDSVACVRVGPPFSVEVIDREFDVERA